MSRYWWKSEDPEAEEEEGKYNNPAPSRTFVLQYLKERATPLHYGQLSSAFALDTPEQLEALRRRLIAMCRDGQLVQNRKQAFCVADDMPLIAGQVQGHRDGYGFLIPDDGSADFFLTPKQMNLLFDGDKVMVRETEIDQMKRRWCSVVEVLERALTQLAGIYKEENGTASVQPENARVKHNIIVEPGALTPEEGQYVVIEITKYPGKHNPAMGVVKDILGFQDAPGVEIEIAVRNYNIPHEWPHDIKQKIKQFSKEVTEEDSRNRVDLRHLPLVTIDGEDARDFDDAVYAKKKLTGGWRLFVAIADVSHYVTPDDALDREAQNRGNSVYFPGRVIPMLPEVLSNGLCSLNPKVDRLAMVCEMTISARGNLSGYTFYEGIIRSHARLTYTKASAILETPDSEAGLKYRQKFKEAVPSLETLYSLYRTLNKVREKRGALEFDTVETHMLFDNHKKIKAIVPTVRNDAHKLIEECMLCANLATARFFEKHGLSSLFRIHKGPTEQKLENLYTFLGEMGLYLPGKAAPEPADYQALLSSIQDRSDAGVIQSMLLRSLSQAEYHPDNIGHFGLAYESYAHFTSPIRRYPDLLAHRAIRHIIRSKVSSRHVRRLKHAPLLKKDEIYPYDQDDMLKLGEQCSTTERRADEAVRDVATSLKCQYIQQHVGEIFTGKVVSVTGFGLFVELDDVYVTGLVHISGLPDDYYHYDNATQRLVGEHTRKVFQLGDMLDIRVLRVNVEEKNIDFELQTAGHSGSGKATGKSKQGSRRREGGANPAKKSPGNNGTKNKRAVKGKKSPEVKRSRRPVGKKTPPTSKEELMSRISKKSEKDSRKKRKS